MVSGGDRYTEWDAAYVLGALSPSERLEFEDHLSHCTECQTAVSELAGMPGLLAQVPITDLPPLALEPPGPLSPPPQPTPDGRLPRLAGSRRRLVLSTVGVAAAFVLGVLGGFAGGGLLRTDPAATTTVSGPTRVAFSPVTPSSMTAVLDIVPQAGATTLQVECQYGWASAASDAVAGEYGIYVIDRAGRATAVKTWTVRPNRVMRPSATANLQVADIAAVEIRRVTSEKPLLRADLS